MEGVTFKKPAIIVIGFEDDDPKFGKIKDIFTTPGAVLFSVQELETLHFSRHFHSYIEETPTQSLVEHSKLIFYSTAFKGILFSFRGDCATSPYFELNN